MTTTIVTTIRQQYPASIAPYINQSRTWGEVCQLFLSAEEQRQAGQYEAALKLYDQIKVENESMKTKIVSERTQTYLDWAANLKKRGKMQQVGRVLAILWDSQEINQQQALSIGLTNEDLMRGLSQSAGVYAQTLMDEALSKACKGQPSESTALAVSEYRRTILLSTVADIALPVYLQATTPGELYYAVCISERIVDLDSCDYWEIDEAVKNEVEDTLRSMRLRRFKEMKKAFESLDEASKKKFENVMYPPHGFVGEIIPQQVVWDVKIRDIRTGRPIDVGMIRGESPTCPARASFETEGETKYITGEGCIPKMWLRLKFA